MKTVALFGALIAVSGAALARDGSCLATAGRAKASMIVAQCKSISEATHPPCHVDNPCAMIVDEIVSWCGINRKSRLNLKPFCKDYPDSRASGRQW
ncbi:MAG: hypothetical protein ABW003_09460 [Microvirga sp.]